MFIIFEAIEIIRESVWIFEELKVLVSFKHQVFDIPADKTTFRMPRPVDYGRLLKYVDLGFNFTHSGGNGDEACPRDELGAMDASMGIPR